MSPVRIGNLRQQGQQIPRNAGILHKTPPCSKEKIELRSPPYAVIQAPVRLKKTDRPWDGNSPQYGPDRLRVAVAGGPTLLDTSFSNNHKVDREGSDQDYPQPKSPPQTASRSTNTLAYDFFGDAIYHFEFAFSHNRRELQVDFASSLFEGKGTNDESWGIDNVSVDAVMSSESAPSSAPASR